jgi:hypothetical protein
MNKKHGEWWIVSVHADDESALEIRFDDEDGGIHVIDYKAFEVLVASEKIWQDKWGVAGTERLSLMKERDELRLAKPNAGSTDTLTEKYNLRKQCESLHNQMLDGAEKEYLLDKKCNELREELTQAKARIQDACRDYMKVSAQCEEMAEALLFYGDPGTYFAIGFIGDAPHGDFLEDFDETELGQKPGKKAREVLNKFYPEEGEEKT